MHSRLSVLLFPVFSRLLPPPAKIGLAEASQREVAALREAADAGRLALERERETAAAQHSRLSAEVDRLEGEVEGLRRQLDNAVCHGFGALAQQNASLTHGDEKGMEFRFLRRCLHGLEMDEYFLQ